MGVYFSQTAVTFARDFAAVRNSEVSARRELTVLVNVFSYICMHIFLHIYGMVGIEIKQ